MIYDMIFCILISLMLYKVVTVLGIFVIWNTFAIVLAILVVKLAGEKQWKTVKKKINSKKNVIKIVSMKHLISKVGLIF